jgi:hypothetical protein
LEQPDTDNNCMQKERENVAHDQDGIKRNNP